MRYAILVLVVLWGQSGAAQNSGTDPFGPQFLGFGTSFSAGDLSQTGQPDVPVSTFGLSTAVRLGGDKDRPVYLEFGWSTLNGDSQSETTRMLADQSPFAAATQVSPTGDLFINTFTDDTGAYATSVVTLIESANDSASISSTTFSPQGGQTSVFAYTPTDTGGLFTSVVTDGTGGISSAIGAIFDGTGAVVLADGNAGATQVVTTRHDRIDFDDGSLRISTVVPLENGWSLVPRGGLVLQSFDRSTSFWRTVSVDDGFAAQTPTPELSIIQNADLRTDLAGLSLGMGISRQISDIWRVSLGADLGAAQGRSDYSAYERVALDAQDVQFIAGPQGHDDTFARSGRISISVSRQLAQGGVLGLSLYSQAMDGIPYLDRLDTAPVAPVVSDDGNDAGLTVSGETNQTFAIRHGTLRNSGVSVSLVWMF